MTKSERNELSLSDQDSMMAQKISLKQKRSRSVHLMVMMVEDGFDRENIFLLWFHFRFIGVLSLSLWEKVSLSLFVYSRLNSWIKRESNIVQHERD